MAYPNAFCVKCGTHTNTEQKHTVILSNNARALKGVCPTCDSKVYKILPKNKAFKTTIDSNEAAKKKYPHAYCVKCQDFTPTNNARSVVLKNGAHAMKGDCSKCGSESYRILGNQKLESAKIETKQEVKQPKKASNDRRIAVTRRAEVIESPEKNWAKWLAIGLIAGAVIAGLILV